MISIAVVALLFILLIVFCVISAKNWHWSNIVFLILAYIAGVAACGGMAQVLDKRTKVLKQVKQSETKLAALQKDYSEEINGPSTSEEYSEESLRGRTAALQLQLHGRGRAWSGTVTGGQTKTFTLPQARDLGGENPVTLKNVVLFAFLNELDPSGSVYPRTFIGTVRVANETETAWTLKPEFIVQDGIFGADGDSWSLYEKMPADRHDTFTNVAGVDIEDDDFDLTAYRNLLETQYLPANVLGFAVNDQDDVVAREAAIAYERFIDKIAFDGMSLGDIDTWIESAENRVSGDFTPPPEEVFYKYQFTKKSSAASPFLVDADGDPATEGPFTRLGMAIDKTLHNGGEVRFDENDIVLVDSKNATGYRRQDQQVVLPFNQRFEVKELEKIFIRRLYNFPLTLEKIRIHIKDLDEKTEVIKSDIVISEGTLEDANVQGEERDLIIGRLREDNVNLTQDVEVIDELLKKRESQLESMRQQVSESEETLKRRRGDSQ